MLESIKPLIWKNISNFVIRQSFLGSKKNKNKHAKKIYL